MRQLITMTSGVKWNEDYANLNSDVAKEGLTILEPGVNPVVSYMRRLPREAPPGSKFVYKTGETDLAGVLLSNAVGMPMAQYLSEKIWKPYGMEQDGWPGMADDLAGHERAGGCCISSMTLRDYGRFGQRHAGRRVRCRRNASVVLAAMDRRRHRAAREEAALRLFLVAAAGRL